MIEAYLNRMPVINARESIEAANRHAMGAGTLEKADAYRISSIWSESAQVRRESAEVSDADLAAMGVNPRRRRERRAES